MTSEIFSEIGAKSEQNWSKIGENRSKFEAKTKQKTLAESLWPRSIFIKMAQFFLYVIFGIFTTTLSSIFG